MIRREALRSKSKIAKQGDRISFLVEVAEGEDKPVGLSLPF